MKIQHNNHFDIIRILTAWAVIFSHHFPITGTQAPGWLDNQKLSWAWIGGVAVMTFFIISGYLVTLSWQRMPQTIPFLWRRVLRLWPGLFGSVFICIFLFGINFTSLSTRDFLTSPEVLRFASTLTLVTASSSLPAVFTGQPVAGLMNGPYWTIPLEFFCYCALALAGLMGLLRRRSIASMACVTCILWYLILKNEDFSGEIQLQPMYAAYFAAGSLIAINIEWFQCHAKKLLIFLSPICIAIYLFTPFVSTARFILWPILIISWGRMTYKTNWPHRLGDPSYGIYLYGFPIAQAVTALWPTLSFGINLTVTIFLATAAGYISWWLIESRALRLKTLWLGTKNSTEGTALRVR